MTDTENAILTNITSAVNSLTEQQLDILAESTKWGSHAGSPRPLNELDSAHLENILITQRHIAVTTSKTILHILKKRRVI